MTNEQRYRYHAYNYGWQRAMLGRYEHHEPVDPQGDWYVSNMTDRAEDYHRKRLGMPARRRSPPMPIDPTIVRPNWRQLLLKDLTPAEHELAQQARDEIMRRLISESPKAAAMVETALGDLSPRAPEIPPP